MTRWHADVDAAVLSPGAEVTVLSHHDVVRVITSDSLLIQRPDGQRVLALVLDRTAGKITLSMPDGQTVSLQLLVDDSLQPPDAGNVFSQQKWMMH